MLNYRPPSWLPGGHAQTIWPALFSRTHLHAHVGDPAVAYRRERWTTPDGDFVDVDRVDGGERQPLLVLLHGLEGSSRSHYARAFASWARQANWHFAVVHFRGCGGEPNHAPRAYHCGDYAEVDWILQRLRAGHAHAMAAVGVSLGGNALMRWAGEVGSAAATQLQAAVAISAPLDMHAAGVAMARGLNRQLYTRMFLHTLKPKALRKLQQHPGLGNVQAIRQARTLAEFDDAFTAPVHGFANAADYYTRASAKPHLKSVRLPALLINARNDPFVPAKSLPQRHEVGPDVQLWQPPAGGHVGFAAGPWPGHVQTLPQQVGAWLATQGLGAGAGDRHG